MEVLFGCSRSKQPLVKLTATLATPARHVIERRIRVVSLRRRAALRHAAHRPLRRDTRRRYPPADDDVGRDIGDLAASSKGVVPAPMAAAITATTVSPAPDTNTGFRGQMVGAALGHQGHAVGAAVTSILAWRTFIRARGGDHLFVIVIKRRRFALRRLGVTRKAR
jgi:hypothetical protein